LPRAGEVSKHQGGLCVFVERLPKRRQVSNRTAELEESIRLLQIANKVLDARKLKDVKRR